MAPQSNLSDRLKAFADRFAALGRPSRPGGGYSGLAGGPGGGAGGLGAPLVVGGGGGGSTGGSEGYYSSGGVAAPPQSRYDPPQTTSHGQQQSYGSLDVAGGGDAGAGAAVNLPTQAEDLAELTALSREAAEIMWEFAALGEKTPAAREVAEKARALRAQLRGLISDFAGGDETALAASLEAFEMLETTLGEYDGGSESGAGAGAGAGTTTTTTTTETPSAAAPAAAEANPFASVVTPPPAAAAAAPRPTTAPGSRPDPSTDAPLISFD